MLFFSTNGQQLQNASSASFFLFVSQFIFFLAQISFAKGVKAKNIKFYKYGLNVSSTSQTRFVEVSNLKKNEFEREATRFLLSITKKKNITANTAILCMVGVWAVARTISPSMRQHRTTMSIPELGLNSFHRRPATICSYHFSMRCPPEFNHP